MSRLKKAMKEDGLGHVYWTPHSLKRKGISDAETSTIAEYKTEAMVRLYDTKAKSFKPSK
jgi:hypothetical protein